MKVHFVIHEAFEAPGAFETWTRDRGYVTTYSRLHAGQSLPSSVDDFDLLVVLGGPQSPDTTIAECAHFDAAAEKTFIARTIAAGRAVIGVCLGAQLIGSALGARHERSPQKEVGRFPVWLTDDGVADEKLSDFGARADVGHWHSDMPGLTGSSRVLAYSEGCPRQIVQYGEIVYGFQCHTEFTPAVIELLIAASEGEFASPGLHPFVQSPAQLRANDYGDMNRKLFGFLDKLIAAYLRRPAASERTAAHVS